MLAGSRNRGKSKVTSEFVAYSDSQGSPLYFTMLNVYLPDELKEEYNSINKKYENIQDTWKEYEDQIIPEDKEFAKRIMKFLINVIDFIIENYEKVDIKKYQEFLGYYNYEFLYGEYVEDSNYLDFDESDGEPISEFCWELQDEDFDLTKDKLKEIRQKYAKVLELLNEE